MPNRVFVSCLDGMDIAWLENVEPFVQKALRALGVDGMEVSVLICDDGFIAGLNSSYRNVEGATDVLSFEDGSKYTDGEGEWVVGGDIAVSVETLFENARYFNTGADDELKRLLLHGVMHLCGMDHGDEHIGGDGEGPRTQMLLLQERILCDMKEEKII